MKTTASPQLRSERGTALIVALILSAVVGIALVSYIGIGRSALNLANRSFLNNAAMNIAEAGLEKAMWSLNQAQGGSSTAWSGWTTDSGNTDAWQNFSFPAGTLQQNASAGVKVYVQNYPAQNGQPVYAVAQATVTPAQGGSAITKMVKITLGTRSFFAAGLVAKGAITFSGSNSSVDSWNSLPTGATTPVPYSASVRHDKGTVGSLSVSVGAISLSNASIYGSASVGGTGNAPQVGPNGTILGANSPVGVKVDPNRVFYDFTANLEQPSAPTAPSYTAISSITGGTTLPRSGDTPNADGNYYYQVSSGISLSGNKTLTIAGNVVLNITSGTGSSAISVSGNSGIAINSGASLVVYTAGNVSISGNGIANANARPSTSQIWGTNTSPAGQTISITGNGSLKSIVYAPNASISVTGNGDVMGAMIGNTINFTGNAAFHYDESLDNFNGAPSYRVTNWQELVTAGDRSAYAADFNF